MTALAQRVRGAGRVYLTGGGTAVLYGWRAATIDIDLKEEIDVNIELASPDDFVPALPDWRERSVFIARRAAVDFFHYDLYGQALAKIERGHERDLVDVQAMLERGLIRRDQLRDLFIRIEPELIRYPAIDPVALHEAVFAWSGNS